MPSLEHHEMILILVCQLCFTNSTCALVDLYFDLNCMFKSQKYFHCCFQGDSLSSGRHWIGSLGRLLPNSQIKPYYEVIFKSFFF